MRDLKRLAPWILAAVAGGFLCAWAFPRAFPFFPAHWTVSAGEAKAIALERLRGLPGSPEDAEPVAHPYVVTDFDTETDLLERRLQLSAEEVPIERLRGSGLARRLFEWRVSVYAPGAYPGEWTYRARVAADGRVTSLLRRIDPEVTLPPIASAQAIRRADAFLTSEGFDLARYDRPQVRSRQLTARTDLILRYRSKEAVLGDGVPYGVEVHFAGDRLIGYDTWHEDPGERDIQKSLQVAGIWGQLRFLGGFLIVPLVAILFLRRYHAGEVGVRRALKIFVTVLAGGALDLVLCAPALTEGQTWGVLTRQQIVWQWSLQFLILFFVPIALAAFLSWAVGESLCRERWSHKLAAFDSALQGSWANATVARSAVRGVGAGLALLGVLLAASVWLRPLGAWPRLFGTLSAFWINGPLPGLTLVALAVVFAFYKELFGRLFLVPALARPMGLWAGGAVVAVVTGLGLFQPFSVTPVRWAVAAFLVQAGVLVVLFVAYDLMTVLLAAFTLEIGFGALALIFSANPSYQVQGWLAFAVAALPAALSIRAVGSGREFIYRWDDVPPHVRRIAERERQRVELETARRIQSSILPELPPRLAGVDLAHAYLPASEVGGDFYDVLALEDGRLVLAVGDVAGHGVSSGLVMSAVKSALAVQVTFDPEVEAVFATLNRMVFQSARRRLIATLCYALLDPVRREIVFASAGHLYPYLVQPDGRVRSLVSTAYPLGVRERLEIAVTKERLAPGDTVVLLSDGVIEARPEGSTDLYGFDRLEASLRRHAGQSVEQVRDGILGDLTRFVGPSPREDDQTLLVLRVP